MKYIKNLKFNKKGIISLILAGSIALCTHSYGKVARTGETNNDNSQSFIEMILDKKDEYIDSHNIVINLQELNDDKYVSVEENQNKFTLLGNSNVYLKKKNKIKEEINIEEAIIVTVLSKNDKYAEILLPDGRNGYVDLNSLIKCPNISIGKYVTLTTNKDMLLKENAYLYDVKGMYLGYRYEGTECTAVATNGEYTLVTFEGEKSAYVKNASLVRNSVDVNGYALVLNDTYAYNDKDFHSLAYYINANEVVYVLATNGTYSIIQKDNGTYYMKANTLDKNFVVVDLNDQRMDCYLDYQLVGSWGTRSGRDSSPTHTGAFDIDWKAVNWEFTTFPGSHAKHWIPINEYGEGIHDLVGDDEQNYGNEAYHTYGSHGCIRVPAEASEFVYENYDVGDMVLVRKK